jgi:uncharacterized membrane-anchored protein
VWVVASSQSRSKVPLVGLLFWVVKVLTTGMGETTSDFLVHTLVPQAAVVTTGIGFAIAML